MFPDGSAASDAAWLSGLAEAARAVLPGPVHEYISQGARESRSANEADDGWSSVRFAPHVLRDVTAVQTGVRLLGQQLRVPWGVAPTTLQRTIHPDGELATARATRDAGSLMVVSSNAGTSFADIGATGVPWWVQAYLPADRTLAEPLLARAVAAGARAVVLTVDTPVVGTKYVAGQPVWDLVGPDELRVNFDIGYDACHGAEKARDLSGRDIAWLAELTGLPVVVKGVLRPDDARRCVEAGAAAIWVSNHGGRQLDRAAPTSGCLPAVLSAVGGAAEVYVDGGLRSALDVLAALALGADAAFLGRLPLYALVDGEAGVSRLHRQLSRDLEEALRLAGCRDVREARGLVWAPSP